MWQRVGSWVLSGLLLGPGASAAAEVTNTFTIGSGRLVCEYDDGSRTTISGRGALSTEEILAGKRPFGELKKGKFVEHPHEILAPLCPEESPTEAKARARAETKAAAARLVADRAARGAAWTILTNGPWVSAYRSLNRLGTMVHCQTETGDWYVSFETRSYVTALDAPVDVSLKFDDGEREPVRWVAYGTNRRGPGHRESAHLLARLLSAESFQLGVANYRNQWQYGDYVAGGANLPGRVAVPCRIELH